MYTLQDETAMKIHMESKREWLFTKSAYLKSLSTTRFLFASASILELTLRLHCRSSKLNVVTSNPNETPPPRRRATTVIAASEASFSPSKFGERVLRSCDVVLLPSLLWFVGNELFSFSWRVMFCGFCKWLQ
ncbi:unnamed protein product [Lathyrus oleraceus]